MSDKEQTRNTLKWLIPVIAVVAVIVVAAIFLLGKPPESAAALPANISVDEASELFKQGAFMLDVRQPEEWAQGHIDGAILIPLGELESRISEIPTDRDVLIICRSGNRSTQARELLRSARLTRTTSIMGGMNAWLAAGMPVVTGN